MFVQLLGFACNIGSIAILTRYLSMAEFGYFSLVVSIITVLVVLVTSSTSDLSVKETSSAKYLSNTGGLNEIAFYCGYFALAMIAGLSLMLIIAAIVSDNLSFYLALMIIVSVFVLSFVSLIASMVRGLGFAIAGQSINAVYFPALFLVMTITGVYFSHSFSIDNGHNAVLARVLAGGLALALAVPVFFLYWPSQLRQIVSCTFRKEWLYSSFEFLKIGVFGAFSRQASIFLLAAIASLASVGEYRVVLLGVSVFEQISIVGVVMLQAKFAQGELSERADYLKRQIFRIYGSIFLVALIGLIVFVVFGETMIILIFGDGFERVYLPLVIVISGHVVNLLFGPIGILMTMRGFANVVSYNLMIGLLINLLISSVLIAKFGVTGAAIGFVSGMFVFNILSILSCREKLKFNPSLLSALSNVFRF
jgi:O-antigen/teichoic acid export membrane protein